MSRTEGKRIYAVGDIHGCIGALDDMRARIDTDLGETPHPAPVLVFLGDYIDRGPDTRAVIDALLEIRDGPPPAVFLRGNHDQLLLDCFPGGEPDTLALWRFLSAGMGGAQTLASYGMEGTLSADDIAREAEDRIPEAHIAFLRRTVFSARIGGYIFAHAGIRPGVPLDRQAPEDLIWIREPFLHATGAHEGIVVHGHTPVSEVRHHGNRIEVDTGAVFGGHLSCVVLEDDAAFELTPSGRVPLRPVA